MEHLLSALGGAGVTDVDIEVDGPEVPILDGSSAPWFEAIQGIGLIEQDPTRAFEVEREVTVAEGDAYVSVGPGDGVFRAVYERYPFPGRLEFSHRWEPATYGFEVAPARTFAAEEDVKRMQSEGLLSGGTTENALVFGQTGYFTACR
ncbi:MAG: UDP-3-O-[3-hydroxymyristoyl] N-acetylglucosamine deacetylase, partial [Armatimonadota bacterium]